MQDKRLDTNFLPERQVRRARISPNKRRRGHSTKKNKQIILTTETHGLTLKSKARSPPNTDWHYKEKKNVLRRLTPAATFYNKERISRYYYRFTRRITSVNDFTLTP